MSCLSNTMVVLQEIVCSLTIKQSEDTTQMSNEVNDQDTWEQTHAQTVQNHLLDTITSCFRKAPNNGVTKQDIIDVARDIFLKCNRNYYDSHEYEFEVQMASPIRPVCHVKVLDVDGEFKMLISIDHTQILNYKQSMYPYR